MKAVQQLASECRLDFPEAKGYPNVEFWVDEAIWGHRLYDQATPDLILLEMLNVVDSIRRQHLSPFRDPKSGEQAKTSFRRSLVLRTILFNNPTVNAYCGRAEAWEHQLETLYQVWTSYPDVDTVRGYGIHSKKDFGYLKERFKSYEAFASLIDILRKGAFEYDSNKRWTSRFLFPYAPEALFEDLSDKNYSSDRRFFGRSGELAYLMLCRSGLGSEIWERLNATLFDQAKHAARWRRAITTLMHPHEIDGRVPEESSPRLLGYLPYDDHPLYRTFGEDVLTLLRAGMPEYDALPHLARVVAFHLAHYLLTVSVEGLDPAREGASMGVRYILEVHSPKPDAVRRSARYSYQLNDELPSRRIEAALERIKRSPAVSRALERQDKQMLKEELRKRWWPQLDSYSKATTAVKLWNEFCDRVRKRHRQHLGKVHHEYMRLCGFSSREGTNAYRYCPNDAFLRTLVLANVAERMDYESFLDRLFERYGVAIAKRHARLVLPGDLSEFDANAERLLDRLTRLGLVYRLSDACAYVINRYKEDE